MKAGTLALIVLIVAAVWVWRNHTSTKTEVCVQAVTQVCVEKPTTTARRR